MRTTRRLLLVAALSTALAGCGSLFEPFETVPVPAAAGDTRPHVGICFDGLISSADEVRAAAQAACPSATVAERIDTDYEIEYCPLLLPGRATFACTAQR